MADWLSALAQLGPALAPITQPDTQARNYQHLNNVFAANPDFAQKLYGQQNEQSQLALLARQVGLKEQAAQQGFNTDIPSAIQEYQYYAKLPPEEQARFLGVKRANQLANLGGTQAVIAPTGEITQQYQVTPKESETPQFEADVVEAKKMAENAVEKEIIAPRKVTMIDNNLKVINDALAQPGFDKNFGKIGALPNMYGSEAADAATYIDQIRGGAFLTAVGEMKGSGALSDAEGKAATAAVTRLQGSQSAKSARQALADLKDILENAKGQAVKGTSLDGAENPLENGTGSVPRIVVTKSVNGKNYGQDADGNWYEQ